MRLPVPPASSPLAAILLALTLAATDGMLACRGTCRTLQHCDAEQCSVLSAVQVGRQEPEPVGCVEKERDNAPGVSTYARDGAGVCWIFPTTLLAAGFVEDDSCSP